MSETICTANQSKAHNWRLIKEWQTLSGDNREIWHRRYYCKHCRRVVEDTDLA